MAAKNECLWSVYVKGLVKCLRISDVRSLFERYGRIMRCDIKYDTDMAYAFIDYQVRDQAENCITAANGRVINGHKIIVEWAKERKDREVDGRSDSSSNNLDVCLRCRRMGHWVRDCPEVGRLGRRGGGGRSRSPLRRSQSRYGSKSKSHSRSQNQKLESHSEREANGKNPQDNRLCDDEDDDDH